MNHDQVSRRLIGEALALASPQLSPDEMAAVQEFLEQNENGLALETLVGIFGEVPKTPPAGLRDLVLGAAEHMKMDGASLVRYMEEGPPKSA